MVRSLFRLPLTRLVALCSTVFLAAGCGGDDGGGTGLDISLTVQQLASQLNVAAGGDPLTENTEKSIADLSADIARVMASKGVPAPPPVGGARPQVDNVSRLLASGPREPANPLGEFGSVAGFGDLTLSADGPLVLGVTCVWNIANDFWGGSPDKYGPVPTDGTRFEMYQTVPGAPLEPLQVLGTFVDVRPLVQASEDGSAGNVNLVLSARNTSSELVSLLLAGQSRPQANVIDLLMTGDVRTGGGTITDYLFSINNNRAANVMEVGDILIIATLQLAGGPRGSMLIQKRDDPRQAVEYDFALSANGTAITAGDVFVGSSRVASIAGDRQAPLITLSASNFDEVENLELIYENIFKLDGGINELFFFAHCVGSDEPVPCQQMVSALLGTN